MGKTGTEKGEDEENGEDEIRKEEGIKKFLLTNFRGSTIKITLCQLVSVDHTKSTYKM